MYYFKYKCILAVIGVTTIIQSCKLKPTNVTTIKIAPNEVVNIVPGHVTCGNLANRAFKEFFLSKYSKAVCDFDSALHHCRGGKDTLVQIYTYRAAAEIESGNYKNALSDCNTALKLNKRRGDCYLFKGAAEVYLGNYKSAIKDENKASTLLNKDTDSVELDLSTNLQIDFDNDSIDFKTLDSLDMYYYKNKKYNIHDIMYGLKYNSVDGVQGLLDMDTLYSNIATFKLHRVSYDGTPYEQDYSSATLYWIGFYYQQLNRPDSSVKYYTKAISLDSSNIDLRVHPSIDELYEGRPDIYFSDDNFELAIKDYLKVIKLYRHKYDNIVPSLYVKIGECETGLKQYEKAIKDETTAIAIDSTEEDAYYERGRCYLLLNEREKAKLDLKITAGYDPTDPAEEAFSYLLLGDTAKVNSLFKRPLYFVIDDWGSEDRDDEYGGYIALSPEYYDLSCLLALMDKPQEAIYHLEMALAFGITKKRVLSDPDLNNIKNTFAFRELMKDY